MNRRPPFASVLVLLCVFAAVAVAASIPKPLRNRFVIGDPVWREFPVRQDFQGRYDKVWETVVATILENNYDLAALDKESGYLRTTWNEGTFILGGNWYYRIQISVKLVLDIADTGPDTAAKKTLTKVRLQVLGELTQMSSKGIKQFYRGYDSVILQTLLQDFQSKIGPI